LRPVTSGAAFMALLTFLRMIVIEGKFGALKKKKYENSKKKKKIIKKKKTFIKFNYGLIILIV
jgi:hypothetical protein